MQSKFKTYLLILLVPALLLGCKKAAQTPTASPSNTPVSGLKTLTSFSFTKADNPGLTADAVSTTTGTDISVSLPQGTDETALVASYKISGKTLKVGNREQVSGETANDFSGTVAYQVTAADGTSQNYQVSITNGGGGVATGTGATTNGVAPNNPITTQGITINGGAG